MPITVSIPRSAAERKPRHGEPCNRCGACCYATLCPVAQKVFGREIGPCPALRRLTDHDHGCGLVIEPAAYYPLAVLRAGSEKAAGEAAALLVGSGTGCDARLQGEPVNEQFHQDLRLWDRRNREAVKAAKKTWGV
jgi:hypothetical protein